MSDTDRRILNELKSHLLSAHRWADWDDIVPDRTGFSVVNSALEAAESGQVGLALDRWGDLQVAPQLSREAEEWKP